MVNDFMRFGILQRALPARNSKHTNNSAYIPPKTMRLFYLAGKKQGLDVLFFRKDDVDFQKRRVHAWVSRSKDGLSDWKRVWSPLPDVVYENYPLSFKTEVRDVKQKFTHIGVPVFNPPFYYKASLERVLRTSEEVKRFLPPTKVVKNVSDIIEFLEQHSVVFLKPSNGSQGKGIIRLSKLSDHKIDVYSDKLERNQRFHKLMTHTQFRTFIKNKIMKQTYLVQKGLNLIKMDNRKIDLRVVVHRGEDGNWYCAGIRPKIGKANAIVTNSHAGGTKTTWEALTKWAELKKIPIPKYKDIADAAITAAKHLTKYRPNLSHLGIDVGIDDKSAIYLLDFNALPGRDLLTHKMLLRVTELTAGFASYLARNHAGKASKSLD